MSDLQSDQEPCRHCGTLTRQRASGVPYCSAQCIEKRRRELRRETFRCPYPGCEWEIEWDEDVRLTKEMADYAVEEHRRVH